MKKKSIHIISHTHWDREWYLPYEKHHFLLVKLIDKLINVLEESEDFRSFHLDGQTIILDDYLQVRPEMRSKLQQFIQEGRLHIGPWYILQDEFLTSSEANIRNLQYGMKEAKKWGNVSRIGYFPDSFGNVGQAPQILSQAGIRHAVFGRGVKPTGFNNTVIDGDYESPYSEMMWRSPDGSHVVGILFANWYCTGNEIPVEEEAAKKFWEDRIAALEKYAATPDMLLMNGCDHQPVQVDLPEAIQKAEELFPDIKFIHSNFNDYISKLEESLPKDLKVIDGELRSQKTDGWGTLVNTASARLYLKQANREGETLLEKVAEPLATFAYLTGEAYDHDLFAYAWKTLMQNHPHDSICGCSVDEVHREMETRFEKSKHVTEMIIEDSLSVLTEKIDTNVFEQYGEDGLAFTVWNTSGYERTGTVSVELDVMRQYYAEGVNNEELKEMPLGHRVVIDRDGRIYECHVEDLGIEFGYDLPNDKFRQPYMARKVRLTFEVENVPALGYKTFAWITSALNQTETKETRSLIINERELENDYLRVVIEQNGSLTVTEKTTGRTYPGLLVYEDTGDIGNEYIYKQPNGEKSITTKDVPATVSVVKDTPFQAVLEIVHEWQIPKRGTDLLEKERKELIWFTSRKATRTEETVPFTITTRVTLGKQDKGISIETSFDNQAKDHRLRALFPTNVQTAYHYSDSIFEVAKRSIAPTEEWTNPDHSQHQQAFVDVSNEREGLTIANYGLNEYEILRDGRNTIALTLLRSVGEMGDWGYFLTPEAQCIGKHTVSFRIFPHQGGSCALEAYRDAYQYQVPLLAKQTKVQTGSLPTEYAFLQWDTEQSALTSVKVSEESGDVMLRFFNMKDTEDCLHLSKPIDCVHVYRSNVIEEKGELVEEVTFGTINLPVRGHEIVTIGLEKN